MKKHIRLSLMILSTALASSCNLNGEVQSASPQVASTTENPIKKTKDAFDIETRWISQPIDHAVPDGKKFEQQVIILKPKGVLVDAPVFFMLGNETDSTEEKLIALYNNYGAPKDFIFITADHRGYGQSIPNVNQTVPSYVKIDEVLKDYKHLIDQYRGEFQGPWVGAGYSYGGSLIINFAEQYPGDFDVILSSSALTRYDFAFSEYGEHAEELLGADLAGNFRRHLNNLNSDTLYDETWHSQKHVTAMIVGLSQMQAIQPLRPLIENLAQQSTPEFVASLQSELPPGTFDLLDEWASVREPKTLTADAAKTGAYNWYTWKYQQCAEVGTFFVGGLFPYSEADHVQDCKATFGEDPAYLTGKNWDVAAMLSRVQDPIIIVSGGKDPWLGVGVTPDHTYENIDYQYFPDGLHCPDRYETEAGLDVFERVRAHLEQ